MSVYRVPAKMVCSASGAPQSVIHWGGITDWGSYKWTDGKLGGTDARPGRSDLRGSRSLDCWWHSGWLQSYSLTGNSARPQGTYLSPPPPLFPSNTCSQFSEGTAGHSPGEPGAYIVFTFHSTTTAGWLLWVAGVCGDPVNWCTKQPI